MLLVKDKAEHKLLSRLNQLKNEKKLMTRCLYLKSSEIFKVPSVTPEAAVLAAHELCIFIAQQVNDPEGYVFLCDDHDIFVLAKGLTQKHVQAISASAASYMSAEMAASSGHLYDLQTRWSYVADLVDSKISARNKFEAQQRQALDIQARQLKKENILGLSLDENLVMTIAERRDARDTPEILFVEDDAFSRKLLNGVLKGEYLVSSGEDGQAAIMLYAVKAPDIVFLDIDLPDITGLDVLGKILQMDPRAYIVMLSGNGSRQNVMKSMELGAKGFVGKPFTREKLLAYIERCPTLKTKKKEI